VMRTPRRRASPATDEACDFLLDRLRGGRVAVGELFVDARARGISIETLRHAKQCLEVESIREGFGENGANYWRLPWPSGPITEQAAASIAEIVSP
jgi:hypothetical protein